MKVRMVQQRTGPRWDDRAWPPVGGEMYVDNEEGVAICAAGWAVPVPDDGEETPEDSLKATEETRSDESPAAPESAPEPPETPAGGKPAVNAPKADWVAHATAQGLAAADADSMTKADLVSRFG